MLRQMARGAMILVLIAAVLDSTGRTQPTTPDRIYYRDKKDRDAPPRSVEGELKPAPVGFQVISGGKVVATVSPTDIVRVVPGDVAGIERKDILALVTVEDKKEWEKARQGYEELLKKTANPPEKTRRYLDFKLATMSAHAADEAPDDGGWKGKTESAVKLLEDYLLTNKTGWEVWPVARTCARLQMELGDYQKASRTWASVAQNAGVPADLRQEAALEEIDLLIRAKQYPVASGRIEKLLPSTPAGPIKDKLTIYQLAGKAAASPDATSGVAPIEAKIAKTKDAGVRAVGYGMIGELYLAAEKPREAMWAFLWVEVVYNQDRDDVVKAMVRLTETFRLQNDEDRVKAYREKLRHYRGTL